MILKSEIGDEVSRGRITVEGDFLIEPWLATLF
jgi:hypothetical protein